MDIQLKQLEEAFLEEYSAAMLILKHNKPTASTILLSKAVFALTDYIIYDALRKLPQNHRERFRILQIKFPLIYTIVDEMWTTYTDAYSKPAISDSINLLINSIKAIIQKHEIRSKKIIEIVEKS